MRGVSLYFIKGKKHEESWKARVYSVLAYSFVPTIRTVKERGPWYSGPFTFRIEAGPPVSFLCVKLVASHLAAFPIITNIDYFTSFCNKLLVLEVFECHNGCGLVSILFCHTVKTRKGLLYKVQFYVTAYNL